MERERILELHAETGRAWDEAAAQYAREIEADIAFLRAGGRNFDRPELPLLEPLARASARAIHLQCAGGRDTLSLLNLGAASVVGIDISGRMLACARAKSAALGAPATWIQSDLLQLPNSLDGTADLVYTGRGALCWMLDLAGWACVAARLLAPGGSLFVYDGHPLDWVWRTDTPDYVLDPEYGNYFDTSLSTESGWPECYIPGENVPEAGWSRKHERQWTLGSIVTAVAGAGLVLSVLEEHPDDFWEGWNAMDPAVRSKLPHTFVLVARKPTG